MKLDYCDKHGISFNISCLVCDAMGKLPAPSQTGTPRLDEAYVLRLLGRIADLELSLSQAKRDAERYRWIRENAEAIVGPKINWHWQDEHRPHPPMSDLDSTVDAALAKREGEGEG